MLRQQPTAHGLRWLVWLLIALFCLQDAATAAEHGPLFVANGTAPAVAGYVSPDFAIQMHNLRPVIMASAARHNRAALSGMSDADFAIVLALILYNEHDGWFEDAFPAVRPLTPLYQGLQWEANLRGVGNFSVWPANLRPSVALEILNQQVPLPGAGGWQKIPMQVVGSQIDLSTYHSQPALIAALTAEISDGPLAVEYLAANLERGLYRAHYEGVPVTWRTLAAWHNGGVVSEEALQANPRVADYVRRAARYQVEAEVLVGAALTP
jgi:hypothetical protein